MNIIKKYNNFLFETRIPSSIEYWKVKGKFTKDYTINIEYTVDNILAAILLKDKLKEYDYNFKGLNIDSNKLIKISFDNTSDLNLINNPINSYFKLCKIFKEKPINLKCNLKDKWDLHSNDFSLDEKVIWIIQNLIENNSVNELLNEIKFFSNKDIIDIYFKLYPLKNFNNDFEAISIKYPSFKILTQDNIDLEHFHKWWKLQENKETYLIKKGNTWAIFIDNKELIIEMLKGFKTKKEGDIIYIFSNLNDIKRWFLLQY